MAMKTNAGFSRQSAGYLLQQVYGRLAKIFPCSFKMSLRRFALPLIKKAMYALLYEPGRIFELAGPLEGHKMRVVWPIHKDYVLGTHEPAVREIIREYVKPGYTVIDVGAHIGYYTLLFARMVGEHGLVIAFEPLEENFLVLQENIKLNNYSNVRVVKSAVAEKSGIATLYRDEWFALPAASHITSNDRSGLLIYNVSTVSLDEYVKTNKLQRVDFVKIDVEGAEDLVIKGMQMILLRDRRILVVEVHGIMDGSPSGALVNLERAGYQLWKIEGELGSASAEYRGHVLAIPRMNESIQA